ncbi:unnamed protein product [Cyprideis torosa]|uniref:Uncharacterized protein n=1 Tax=Cyprideis torosa TaxID=163714 RepID=A0A7R8WIY2_9CRUS|nr:unnamed protein product [Cyprideis torosa]CAG0901309.1 unnamed protein product [Cyprideis torosa]
MHRILVGKFRISDEETWQKLISTLREFEKEYRSPVKLSLTLNKTGIFSNRTNMGVCSTVESFPTSTESSSAKSSPESSSESSSSESSSSESSSSESSSTESAVISSSAKTCETATPEVFYKLMFPDSKVAEDLTLSDTKSGYIVKFGLGLYMRDCTLQDLKDAPHVSLQFDESLNAVVQRGQFDCLVKYWIETRYLSFAFMGRARSTDLSEAISDVAPQWLLKKCGLQEICKYGRRISNKDLNNGSGGEGILRDSTGPFRPGRIGLPPPSSRYQGNESSSEAEAKVVIDKAVISRVRGASMARKAYLAALKDKEPNEEQETLRRKREAEELTMNRRKIEEEAEEKKNQLKALDEQTEEQKIELEQKKGIKSHVERVAGKALDVFVPFLTTYIVGIRFLANGALEDKEAEQDGDMGAALAKTRPRIEKIPSFDPVAWLQRGVAESREAPVNRLAPAVSAKPTLGLIS